jgi:hypothetical protein
MGLLIALECLVYLGISIQLQIPIRGWKSIIASGAFGFAIPKGFFLEGSNFFNSDWPFATEQDIINRIDKGFIQTKIGV